MDAYRTAHRYYRMAGLLAGAALLLVPVAPAWSDDAAPAHEGPASSEPNEAGPDTRRSTDSPWGDESSGDNYEPDGPDGPHGYRERHGHSGHSERQERQERWRERDHSERWDGRFGEGRTWDRYDEPSTSRDGPTSPPQRPGDVPSHPAPDLGQSDPPSAATPHATPSHGSAAGTAGASSRPRDLLPLGAGLALIGTGAGLIAVRLRRA